MWMAGGGIKGGQVVGATDEIGLRRSRSRTTSATFTPRSCTSSGLDQDALSYLHLGRKERLTGLHGTVIERSSS